MRGVMADSAIASRIGGIDARTGAIGWKTGAIDAKIGEIGGIKSFGAFAAVRRFERSDASR